MDITSICDGRLISPYTLYPLCTSVKATADHIRLTLQYVTPWNRSLLVYHFRCSCNSASMTGKTGPLFRCVTLNVISLFATIRHIDTIRQFDAPNHHPHLTKSILISPVLPVLISTPSASNSSRRRLAPSVPAS
jgi:hypothetical protein